MLDAFLAGLSAIFSWPTIAFVVLGTFIGITFGALPGLGGAVAIALLIPLTFGLPAEWAFPLFLSTMGGVAFGGSISAILANIPGTPPNAATLLDGYPMTRQGRASEALGVSATASALGALFGVVVLVSLLPFARAIILSFGPPEFFWMVIAGLVLIAVVGEGSLPKNLIAGAMGISLTFVGFSMHGVARYTYGNEFLWSGIDILPVLIGMFAIAEVIKLSSEGGSIAEESQTEYKRSGAITGMFFVLRNPRLLIQSSALGTIVGMVPGAGGTIATFLSYGQGAQSSEDGDSFGSGNPKGVLAAEAANDAKDGGGLLPTLIFGIPGSLVMAVLLGAFQIHGLAPGSAMLEDNLDLLFMMVIALVLSNVLTSTIGVLLANHIAKLTRIPAKSLVPPILVVSLLGAFAINRLFPEVIIAVLFGILGFAMLATGFSRVAFILGAILGPLFERSLSQSLVISDNWIMIFFTRPIALAIFVIVVLSLAVPPLRKRRQARGSGGTSEGGSP